MANNRRNVPNEVTAAIRAANSVERGQSAHHKALVNLILLVVNMGAVEDAFEVLNIYTQDRHAKSPDSLCTKATYAWLFKHFGIAVKDGVASKGKTFDEKGFTVASLNSAKAEPWYNLARDLAFKVPTTLSISGIASQMLKMRYAGAELPSAEDLYEEVRAEMVRQSRGENFAKWVGEYEARAKAGTLPGMAATDDSGKAKNVVELVSPTVQVLAQAS